MQNKPMASWRVIAGFLGLSALICLPIKDTAGDGPAAIVFFALLIATSIYLYSKRFAAFVNGLLARFNLI